MSINILALPKLRRGQPGASHRVGGVLAALLLLAPVGRAAVEELIETEALVVGVNETGNLTVNGNVTVDGLLDLSAAAVASTLQVEAIDADYSLSFGAMGATIALNATNHTVTFGGANTSTQWLWQKGTSPATQMALAANGTLTLYDSATGKSLTLAPGNNSILADSGAGNVPLLTLSNGVTTLPALAVNGNISLASGKGIVSDDNFFLGNTSVIRFQYSSSTSLGAANGVFYFRHGDAATGTPLFYLDDAGAAVGSGNASATLKIGGVTTLGGLITAIGNLDGATLGSSSGGGTYPFDYYGHLILASRGNAPRDIVFMTKTASDGNPHTVKMIIGAGGNVGIGTTAPDSRLGLQGSFKVKSSDGVTTAITVATNGNVTVSAPTTLSATTTFSGNMSFTGNTTATLGENTSLAVSGTTTFSGNATTTFSENTTVNLNGNVSYGPDAEVRFGKRYGDIEMGEFGDP